MYVEYVLLTIRFLDDRLAFNEAAYKMLFQFIKKTHTGAGKMAQQAKVLVTRADNIDLIPESYTI